jgi:hypothetical protein
MAYLPGYTRTRTRTTKEGKAKMEKAKIESRADATMSSPWY